MTPTSLVEAVAPRTGKIITNGLRVFEREKICYKIIYYTLSQSPEIVLQS